MRRSALLLLLAAAACSDDGVGDDEVGGGDVGEGGLLDDPSCEVNWHAYDSSPLAARPRPPLPEYEDGVLGPAHTIRFDQPARAPIHAPPPDPPAPPNHSDLARLLADARPVPGGVLIEQDQFISAAALDELTHQLARVESDTREPQPVALGYLTEGLDATWSASRKLELTWCLGRVFPQPLNEDLAIEHEANVDRIVRNVEAATRAWERAGDVNFIHLTQYDDPANASSGTCQPGQNGILFRVRMGPECLSSCFGYSNFTPDSEYDPTWASPANPMGEEREILWGFASLSSEHQAGITAHHELGHVLGFAHQHLAVEQAEDSECANVPSGFDWRALTPHDPDSVMGYDWCNGIANSQPRLSAYDRLGAYYQYVWGHRRPLVMEGGNLVADYAYDGSERTSLLWYTPRGNILEQWIGVGEPGQPISFEASARKIEPDPHGRTRPMPLFATGTRLDLDLLMVGQGPNLADRLLHNDGFALAPFDVPLDAYVVPVIGSFGDDMRDQVLLYQPGPQTEALWVIDDDEVSAIEVDFPGYAVPLAGRYRGFGGGGNDILWYQPESVEFSVWQWFGNDAFEFLNQAPGDAGMHGLAAGIEYVPLMGDFNGDQKTDLFWYAPGEVADHLWISLSGAFSVTFESHDMDVDGNYRPFVGDFDGNETHDILWYAVADEREGHASVVWYFDEDGSHTSKAIDVHQDYSPYVGDFDDDGCSDILWHRPQSPTDQSLLWRCLPGERAFACDMPMTTPADAYIVGFGGAY
jgi:hypothetical protein